MYSFQDQRSISPSRILCTDRRRPTLSVGRKGQETPCVSQCCLLPDQEAGDGLPAGDGPQSSSQQPAGTGAAGHTALGQGHHTRHVPLHSQVTGVLPSKGENQSTEWKRFSRYQSIKVIIQVCWAT